MVKKTSPAKRRKKSAPPKKAKKKSTAKRRKKLKKTLKKLTPRQILYRLNRLDGKSIFVSAVSAGYGRGYARTSASQKLERLVKASIIEELEIAGGTNQRQAEELVSIAFGSNKVNETTTTIYKKDGSEVRQKVFKDAGISNDLVRLKALDQLGKLKKQISAPFSKLTDTVGELTRLVVVVEKETAEEKKELKDARSKNRAYDQAKSRVALTD